MQRSRFEISFFSIVLTVIISVSSTFFTINLYNEMGPGTNNMTVTSSDSPSASDISYSQENASSVIDTAMDGVVAIASDASTVGTGFIASKSGLIVTNAHVVSAFNNNPITVVYKDTEKLTSKLLWKDPILDIAVLKTEKNIADALVLGDSDSLRVGDTAIAIGNPLGESFEKSVTQGIISGLDRSVKINEYSSMDKLIQTDASINPGNSGGPLLNSFGEVIGINSAKIQNAEGMGFSIPVNTLKPILSQIDRNNDYQKVQLGVKAVNVTALTLNQEQDYGIYVSEVTEGSAAEKADLRADDIITSIDNIKIDSLDDLASALYNYKQGDSADFTVIRNSDKIILTVKFD